MAIDFKEKLVALQAKDSAPLTEEELGYIKQVEDYIDTQIEIKITTDNSEVWIDNAYVTFHHNPITKKFFPGMTEARKKVLQEKLLSRYEDANWEINWHIDDGLDGPNMSGGDYLILKGKVKS
jgi:hypothetical protein